MKLKPWREVAVPHEDVLNGTFKQSEFAADLTRVHDGTATEEYQNASLFFQRTFITEGMRLLLDSVVKRLAGRGGDPVIQLQTAFGGGKTHTLLAVYHIAKGAVSAEKLTGITSILDAAKIAKLPKTNIAVIDGNKLAPHMPQKHENLMVHTIWGELAWQLGGNAGYEKVRLADESGTSPGKEVLSQLLSTYAPCVILVDELVAYIRQFEEGKSFSGGTYDSNLSFIQALTEALKAVPTAVLLASLPESDREAGSQRGVNALSVLSHYFARIHTLWKPVGTEEAFEIVRRRLFSSINDTQEADAVCRAFADYYIENSAELPQETQESRYYERLKQSYPIHPEVFHRLYEDWSSLDNFQRTRGVLKLMAKIIHRLWKDGNNDLMIMPGSLPLYDADIRNEAIYYLPQGWDPVLEGDIDGERAETSEIERDTRLGSVQACRRVARTIFLGSAPSTASQSVRGIEATFILLGSVQPGQQIGVFKDALLRLSDRLHYLNTANKRFWFDTRPNLRREMEERKRRFSDKEDIFPVIRDRLQRNLSSGVFGGVHVFTPSEDIPDDWALRLVVIPPDVAYDKNVPTLVFEHAIRILKQRGEQPRQKQNRLIFLAADNNIVTRLKEQVRALLAWQSIISDSKELRLNLDQYQAIQANKSQDDAVQALKRMINEAYKWVLVPMQEMQPGKGLSVILLEHFPINSSAPNLTQEIERVLKENGLLITEWAPIHLSNMLRQWFWKADVTEANALEVFQKSCQYLYLPRLRDENVYASALAAGSGSRDFFGFAYAKEGEKYIGFTFGKSTAPMLDSSLLLIEPKTASAYEQAQPVPESPKTPEPMPKPGEPAPLPPKGPQTSVKRCFYGSANIDPIQASRQFADIVKEVVEHFTSKPEVTVTISVDIQAETTATFDEALQRVVKENCNTLKFKNVGFERGED